MKPIVFLLAQIRECQQIRYVLIVNTAKLPWSFGSCWAYCPCETLEVSNVIHLTNKPKWRLLAGTGMTSRYCRWNTSSIIGETKDMCCNSPRFIRIQQRETNIQSVCVFLDFWVFCIRKTWKNTCVSPTVPSKLKPLKIKKPPQHAGRIYQAYFHAHIFPTWFF